jgi:hypothetical protein
MRNFILGPIYWGGRGQVLQYYIYEWVSSIKKLALSIADFGLLIAEFMLSRDFGFQISDCRLNKETAR